MCFGGILHSVTNANLGVSSKRVLVEEVTIFSSLIIVGPIGFIFLSCKTPFAF